MASRPTPAFLRGLGYYLPRTILDVEELAASGRTTSTAEKLRQLGYDKVHLASDGERVEEMAAAAIEDLRARSGLTLDDVDLVLYGGGMGLSNVVDPGDAYAWAAATNPLPLFKFPGCRLQRDAGLPLRPVIGVAQLACSTFHSALRLARGLLAAEPDLRNVLCVVADRFPPKANREIVYNMMSDGAVAGIVSREGPGQEVLAASQITRGVYWDCETTHDQLVAGFFPIMRDCLNAALAQVGMTAADLDLIVPHNVNVKSWDLLASVLRYPREKIWTDNIPRFGHAVACDNAVNHIDAVAAGRIRPGDRVAWLVTGFGAHWNCTIVRA